MDKASATDTRPRPLDFETDRGASRSVWIAGAILVALIAWMGSGFIIPSEEEAPQQEAATREAASVVAETSQAEPVTLTFQAEGQALPDRDTPLRAEATGDVEEVLVTKGTRVAAGEVIARLSSVRARADLESAQEARTRAQREIDNAQQLLDRGVATADRVSQARAELAAAEAQVTAAEQALENLRIIAPFPGRIETLSLDEGEFVSAGEEVGRIVDNMPLTVAIQVPQQALNRIRDGQTAEVTFITGETREGTVTFVGTSAAAETRTFLAEIEVPNEGGEIPAGVSARIMIPTGQVQAHFVQASAVSLSPEGDLGIKTVEDGVVQFYPIQIVKAELQGVWVSGLPDAAEIITIGQGFVQQGEAVRAQTPAAVAQVAKADPPGALPGTGEEPVE